MTAHRGTATPPEEPEPLKEGLPIDDTVLDLADDDPALSERQKLLVLASLDNSEAITATLDNAGSDAGSGVDTPSSGEPLARVAPVRAFISSVTVSGFRGIGEAARLDLHPGPGLTVVAGRNGSGKSSFAEAFELALTGDSYRWAGKKASFWKGSWRNLHQSTPAALRIELAEEGAGRTTIGVAWAADANLEDRTIWTQRHGAKRTAGLDSLGWREPLELYRPILSYEELAQRLDGTPTDLFRSIERILGLDQIADGIERLSDQAKLLKDPSAAATAAKAALKPLLESAQDERAGSAFAELRKHKPDLEVLGKIATGVSAPDQVGSQLRALSDITIPDKAQLERAAGELLAAMDTLASIAGTTPARAAARNTLLENALALHAEHGDQTCPVCGDGALDDAWRHRVTAELETEKAELATLRTAQQTLTERRQAARAYVDAPVLSPFNEVPGLTNLPAAQATLQTWRAAPPSDGALAQHLVAESTAVIASLSALREEAEARLSGRDDSWRELAQRLAAWVELKHAANAVDADLADVSAALDWLKNSAETLRNQAVAPLADETRTIWSKLRQDSSIALDAITLSGQRNRGKVNLKASVDGVETDALPVMSQGELNAIALALFLPRATMKASPLQFVILDDPVQAMDPAKVDGLTEVLIEYAKVRQLVVFTHDDRLTESVRRIAPDARIVHVERSTGSMVEVAECQSPARRYVADMRDLAQDPKVPADVLAKAIPGYARLAVEAAAHEVYFRTQLTARATRHEVEEAWTNAFRTRQRVALALYDDKGKDLGRWSRSAHRRRTLTLCGSGVHQDGTLDVRAALDDLGKTVDDLLASRS